MPYNPNIATPIMEGKEVELDFSAMSQEDARDWMDTSRELLGDDVASEMEKMRTNHLVGRPGVAAVVPFSQYSDRIWKKKESLPVRAVRGAGKVFDWAFTSLLPDPGLAQKDFDAMRTIVGPSPTTQADAPQPETSTGTMSAPTQTFPVDAAGQQAPLKYGAMADVLGLGVAAPVGIATELGRATVSPGGLATLPLSMASSPLKAGGMLASRLGLKSAPAIAEVATAAEALPSSVTMAANFIGRKTQPLLKMSSDAAVTYMEASHPELLGTMRNIGAFFYRPTALSEASVTAARSAALGAEDTKEFVRTLASTLSPEENQALMMSFQAGMAERLSLLEKMKVAASAVPDTVVPEQLRLGVMIEDAKVAIAKATKMKSPAGVSPQFSEGMTEYLANLEADKARVEEAVRVKNLTLNQYASELPQAVHDTMKAAARARGAELLPSELVPLRDQILDRFEHLAERQIASKAVKPEVFAIQKGTYVPDMYLSSEIKTSRAFKGVESGGLRLDLERTKKRHVTDVVEKVEKGLQTSVPYGVLKGEIQEGFDATVGEFFHTVSTNPELALPTANRAGWVELRGKGYGALDGWHVHPAVKLEIDGIRNLRGTADRAIDRWMTHPWKMATTVWNPPVHVGNLVSNFMLMDFAGAGGTDDVLRALKSYRSKDAAYQAIRKTGIIGNSEMAQRETEFLMKEAFDSFQQLNDNAAASLDLVSKVVSRGPKTTLGKIIGFPSPIYNAEEDLSKYILAHKGFTRGIPRHGIKAGDVVSAANHAEKWLFNYSDVPYAVRYARGGLPGLLATPFITFQTKVVPRMVEGFINSPEVAVRWKAMLDGWNRVAMHANGMNANDLNEFRRMRSELFTNGGVMQALAESGPVMILPWKDEDGNAMVVDAARFTPWGQIFQPRGIVGGGPLAASYLQATTGTTPTGKKLFSPGAQNELGGISLTPSTETMTASSAVQPFVPPLLRRLLVGGLTAAGPEFTNRGPQNFPAKALETLGSYGALAPEGTRLTLPRQLMSALVATPQSMDMDYLRRALQMKRGAQARETQSEYTRRAKARRKATGGKE